MSFEILLVIATLCQTNSDYPTMARHLTSKCQKEMLECIGDKPSAEKIAQCVKEGKTQP